MNSDYFAMNRSRVLAAYLGDIRFEIVKMLRTPAFAVPTVLFPVMFYVLFGVLMGGTRGNPQFALYALAGYTVFGTMAPGLFGFGVSLAFEREQGMLTYRQALPMPSGAYLLARMATAMAFVTVSCLLLICVAATLGKVPIGLGQAARLLAVNVLGALPFCALGMYVGSLVSGQAAPAIVNLIYLPMAFLSGLWMPLQFLPETVQQLAPLWPAHHLAQLSLGSVGAPTVGSVENHVAALAGVTVLFYFLAMRRLGNRGIHLLGPARGGLSAPLKRALTVGMMWVAIGLVVAGALGGIAPRASANTAATSKGSSESGSAAAATNADSSGAPIGVAAPDIVVLADFDSGSDAASYGMGWHAADDQMRGGNSRVSQRLVVDGARESRGALELTGEVGTAIQYPFVGTSFMPNGARDVEFVDQGFMDYSSKQTLSFHARGDGQRYLVMIMGPVLDAIPAMYGFVAAADWQEVRVPLHDIPNLDLKRVKLISIGSMTPGPFRLQIDDVRLE